MKIKISPSKDNMDTLLEMIKVFSKREDSSLKYLLPFDKSKVKVTQKPSETPLDFDRFCIQLNQDQNGDMVLSFSDSEIIDWDWIEGKTKVEITLMEEDVRAVERAFEWIIPDRADCEVSVPIDPSKIKILQNENEIPFNFKSFRLTLKQYKSGKIVLY